MRSPPGVSGRDVVSAATVAPVGMYVSPLIASADRCSASRHWWSGIRARSSQFRQNRVVACMPRLRVVGADGEPR